VISKLDPEILLENKKRKRITPLLSVWIKFTWYFLYAIKNRKPWSLSPRTWIRLYCRGFLPNKLSLYRFRKNNWKTRINDRQTLLTSYINKDYGIIVDNKLLSSLVLRNVASIPDTWAVIRDRRISVPDSGKSHDLKSLIRERGKAILKPTDKNGGKGIILLEFRNGIYLCNNQVIDGDQLDTLVPESGELILTEYIHQGKFASALYPDTVNTVRLLTMMDPDSGLPFIACAVQRVGTSESFPVDNVSSGGLACTIDIRTGCIGKASRVFVREPFRWIEHHPDNGIQFEGQVIPRWKEICLEMARLAGFFPMIPYIAWDIALLGKGICIIETNSWSDLSVFQLDQPLTADTKIRRFFEHHQICKKEIPAHKTENE
jgi:Sugar-transfer associated ATP-grasp